MMKNKQTKKKSSQSILPTLILSCSTLTERQAAGGAGGGVLLFLESILKTALLFTQGGTLPGRRRLHSSSRGRKEDSCCECNKIGCMLRERGIFFCCCCSLFGAWSEPQLKTPATFSAEPPEPSQRVTILNDYDQNKLPLQFPRKINFVQPPHYVYP